ncbi:G-protein coupled receptor Mth2-like isoform X2 [Sitodiplosis mosellana]|uniref:G-protein coupled receptor Mth2-like isoform X2 n=1 Tax=Sitodiplosis mosellana TaxID=263140 RepID=UPI002444A64B|nr:G-protein coupled receptor Mth2-like isoform X2 [Sitodiplosis mosellana]
MDGCVSPTLQVMSISLIILIGLTSVDCSKLPCYFFDSINITDGIHQPNGSILFDGIDFQYDQYAVLSYIIDNGEKKASKPHFRGCLCNIKPCFRLCCSDKLIKDTTINLDNNCNEELTQMEGEVMDEKHKFINLFLAEQPINVKNKTCKQFYIEEEIRFKIKNAGKVLRQNKTTTIRGYCQTRVNDDTDENDLDVSICINWVEIIQPNSDAETKVFLDYLEHISMILSVPFLIATFLVYIYLPDLHRNLHGKCFLCYLILQALCFIFEILSYHKTIDLMWEPVIIYLFLSAFQWLNVTAFDAWCTFRNVNKTNKSAETKRFILYMLYASLSPFLLNIFQLFSDILKSVNVDPDKVDELEVAGFICTTFTLNIIFFILTALKICQVKKEMYKLTSQEDSSRHQTKFNTAKGNFRMYLRLFIVMGMTYSISGISYLINTKFSEWTEIILSLQGVWIFILFILKPRVFGLIKKRWEGTNGSSPKQSSKADSGNESNSRLK